MVVDPSLLHTQYYKVCIKDKMEQPRGRSSAHPLSVVVIEKGAFESPLTMIANTIYIYIYIYWYACDGWWLLFQLISLLQQLLALEINSVIWFQILVMAVCISHQLLPLEKAWI